MDTAVVKVQHFLSHYPELKELIKTFDRESFKTLGLLESSISSQMLVYDKSPKDEFHTKVLMLELSWLLKYPKVNGHFTHVSRFSTISLFHDYYLNDTDETNGLSSVHDDLVIIEDSPCMVPNKQLSNIISQVFEQNDNCLFVYRGSLSQVSSEHSSLLSLLSLSFQSYDSLISSDVVSGTLVTAEQNSNGSEEIF